VTGAWKYSLGRPEVIVAVVDDGILDYEDPEIRRAFFLNAGELPLPNVNGDTCAALDCNGDGIDAYFERQQARGLPDGVDVRRVALRSLRSAVGTVQQDVFLFSGSVRDNIAYGNPAATEEAIRTAARRAGAEEFITELPAGYDTPIGEKGVKLSGGQKQRLSIARAFLKDPRILILDEATSSLDTHTERIIQAALQELIRDRTTLIIAHRLSTIRNADEIIVLTEDGIAQRGSHRELMRRPGLYAELYKLQHGVLVRCDPAGELHHQHPGQSPAS
jgi:ABC-type transport system involved in cytochrome bd biosynthesis fused ATPase/permease subunit